MAFDHASAGPEQLDKVEQLLEHFEQLEAQFQQMRDGLTHSHRLATLGTITSVIAHEYNNILTPIISYAQLALANEDDRDLMRKAVEKALAGAERAASISSSLLGFAREADHEHAAALAATLDQTLACLGRDPRKDGIELNIDLPDAQVAISPLNLQQVLLNLILNAKRAMRRTGGTLSITGRVDGPTVHIDVADTGPGIPEPIMDRLFEPFVTHRIEADGDEQSRGTGLGLCICRDLIRNAGGSIAVTTAPGQGATFHISLPKADDLFEST
ncbi:MAG: HAMP domain-containing sensor histidine kinase [Phycisphaeraceae bacterium]